MNRPFRKTVIVLAALVSLAYLTYRVGWSLNTTTTYATIASIVLVLGEAFGILSILLYFVQIWEVREPARKPVLEGRSVDVFVPTYNEDLGILRATLEATVRMDYPHRTYLCDDGGTDQRCGDPDPEKAAAALARKADLLRLCEELGVTYMTREKNNHAKAGNLNEAFAKTDGEFLIVFDADHVPERHFITRLLGYFEDERLGYVQTPHAFYNFDSFQARLNHKRRRYWEEGALFYAVIQTGRNRWNCPIFAGSAAMFRRTAMAEVGYIATETITEDMHTGMRLNAKGWRSLAISERMVAGQAAPDITTFHTQRLRWGEGNLSIMAHDNPLTMRGLTLGQRLCYLGSMVHWAGGFFKLLIYVSPILMMLTGVPPVKELSLQLAIITLTYLIASVAGVVYVSNGFGSILNGELFCMVNFWTQIKALGRAIFLRRFQSFVVTSKRGRQSKSIWPYIRPHLVLAGLSFVALSWGWSRIVFRVSDDILKPLFPSFWIVFHLWLIAQVVKRSLWPEDKRYSYRHSVNLHVEYGPVEDQDKGVTVPAGNGVSVDLSETGLGFVAYEVIPEGAYINFRLHGGNEMVEGRALVVHRRTAFTGAAGRDMTGYRYGVRFDGLPVRAVDTINRMTLQYAVPKLYNEYALGNRLGTERRVAKWLSLKVNSPRAEPRLAYHLPVTATAEDGEPQFAVTENVSRRAAAVLFDRHYPAGSDVTFRMDSPAGPVQGTARVYRTDERTIGSHTYHRMVLSFLTLDIASTNRLTTLVGRRRGGGFGDVVTPAKKPLRVRSLKPASAAVLAATVLIAVQLATFPLLYRDELFLHRLASAEGPASSEDIERYEAIYAKTMAQSYPSNDRLVLLMGAMPKVNRFEGRDELTRFLATRDRNNVDLQLALAGTLDKTQDYGQAEAEYRRLFELDRKGRLPESRRRDLLLASARSAVNRGDIPAAAERFEMILKTYPGMPTVRNEYAGVLIQAGRYKDVPRVYSGLAPDYDGHVMLMSAYALDKDFDKAEAESRKLLALRPEDPKAGRLLADLLTYRKSYEQSKALYERLLKENQNDPDIRLKLGQIHLANNHFDEAVIQFRAVLDQTPTRPEALRGFLDAAASAPRLAAEDKDMATRLVAVLQSDTQPDPVYLARLGWVLERCKNPVQALELVRRAAMLAPNDKDIKKQQFGLLVAAGRMEDALGVMQANRADTDVRRLLVDIYLRTGDFAAANGEIKSLLDAQPDDVKLRRLQADVLSWARDFPKSLEAFEKLRLANPGDEAIPLRIAEVTHWSGDAAGALVRFEGLLAAKFDRPEVWRGFVDAAAEAPSMTPSQFRLAVRIAEQPSTRESVNVPFLSRLAWAFVRGKQPEMATPLLEHALKQTAEPAQRKELAGVLAAAGRHRDALDVYDDVPLEPEDQLKVAEVQAALKDHAAAEKEVRAYLARKPADPKAERLLADVLSWKRDFAPSLDLFRRLQKLNPEDAEIPVRIAEVTMWSGSTGAAFEQFEALLKKRPGDARVAEGYIDCCAEAPTVTAAQLEGVTRLLATKAFDPTTADDHAKLSGIFRKAGDAAEAERRLAIAIDLKPTDLPTRRRIGVLLLASNKPVKALEWLDDKSAGFDDRLTLAQAFAAAKRWDEAETHAREAVRLKPTDAKAERLLADVLSWKGDFKAALAMFAAIRKRAPDDVDVATRIAEVTLWSGDAPAALWLLQDLLERKFDQPRLWTAFVDAAAAAPKLTAAQSQLAVRVHDASRDAMSAEPDFLARLAWVMYQAGRPADSAALIDRALQQNPTDPKIRREIAGICGVLGKASQAIKLFEGLELTDADKERLVGLQVSAKDYVAAETLARELAKAKPADPVRKRLLADVFRGKGDYKAALDVYQELRAANPDDAGVDLLIAAVLHASGDSKGALAKYDVRLAMDFEQPEVWRAYVDAAAAVEKLSSVQGQWVRRIAVALKTDKSEDALLVARLAMILQRENDPLAKGLLERALKLDATTPAVRRELAGVLAAAGRPADALKYYKGLELAGEDLLSVAGVHAAVNDFPSALKACRTYLSSRPGDARGERLLADLQSWSGRHDDAIAGFERLYKANPADHVLAARAAETTLWAGRPAEAIVRFERVLAVDPANGVAVTGFVESAFALPALSKSRLATLDRIAGEAVPTAHPLFLGRLAVLMHRQGRAADAAKFADRAVAATSATGPIRRQVGGLLALAGKEDKAALLWSGLPFSPDEAVELARLYQTGRDIKAALQLCNALLAKMPDHGPAQRLLADLLAADRQYPAALTLLKKLRDASPADEELPLRHAEVLLASGDAVGAMDVYQKELERDPSRPRPWAGFVDAAAGLPALTPAQKAFVVQSLEKSTLRESTDPAFLSRFAWLLHVAGRKADAVAMAEKAMALKPETPRTRKDLAGVMLALGNEKQATQLYEGLPLDGDDRLQMVNIHNSRKDFVTAERQARALLAANPEDPKLRRLLADTLSWKQDHTAALEVFAPLVKANPDDAELRTRVAEVRLYAGDRAGAAAKFRAMLEKDFEKPALRTMFVDALSGMKSVAPADAALAARIAKTTPPTEPLAAARLALVLHKGGDKSLVAPLVDKAAAAKPADPAARRELAGLLAAVGQPQQGLALFEGLTLTPDDRIVRMGMFAAMKDLEAAEKEARVFVKEANESPASLKQLAEVLTWRADLKGAAEVFARVAAVSPNDPDLAARAAEIATWSGDYEAAAAKFEAVLGKEFNQPNLWPAFLATLANTSDLSSARKALAIRVIAEPGIAESTDVAFLVNLAWIAHRLDKKVEADAFLAKAIARKPAEPAQRKMLAGVLDVFGRNAEALAMFEGLTLDAADRLQLAGVYSTGKQYDLAEKQIRAALAAEPANRKASRMLADVLSWQGRHSESLAEFAKLTADAPADRALAVRVAEVTLWSRDYTAATRRYRDLLDASFEQPQLWGGFIDAAASSPKLSSADLKTAASIHDRILAEPRTLTTWCRLAWIHGQGGDKTRQLAAIDKAAATKPTDPAGKRELAAALSAAGRFKEALAMHEGLTLDTADHLRLAGIHSALKNFDAAADSVRLARASNPQDPETLTTIADVLSWSRQYSDAIALYQRLLQAKPDDAALSVKLANVLLWAGRFDESAARFAAMLEKDFDQPALWVPFLDAAAGAKTFDKRAVRVLLGKLHDQVANDPSADVEMLKRLGVALAKAGDPIKGVAVLRKAVAANPGSRDAKKRLASALTEAGQYGEADRLYRELLNER